MSSKDLDALLHCKFPNREMEFQVIKIMAESLISRGDRVDAMSCGTNETLIFVVIPLSV